MFFGFFNQLSINIVHTKKNTKGKYYISTTHSNQWKVAKKIKIKTLTARVARGKQKIILGMFDLHFQVVLIIVPKGTRPECQVFFVIGVDIGCSHSWINTEKIVQYIASKQAV